VRKILLIALVVGGLLQIPGQGSAGPSNMRKKGDPFRQTLEEVRARGKLIAGVPANDPPFGFTDEKGSLKGIDVDIAEALAKEILGQKAKVEFVKITAEKMLDLLKSGKIDILLAPLSVSEERKKEIDFSIPYFVSGHLFLVERDAQISKYKDLAGKKVAVIQGTMGERILKEIVPSAKAVQFRHNREALQALKRHQVDAMVQLDVFIFYMEEKDKKLRVFGLKPIDPSPIVLGVRKNDREWRTFVDKTLLKMMATGEYHEILDKWFGKVRGEFLELALKREIKVKEP
jgi:putative glutamine transport system substrate-binding protein